VSQDPAACAEHSHCAFCWGLAELPRVGKTKNFALVLQRIVTGTGSSHLYGAMYGWRFTSALQSSPVPGSRWTQNPTMF
jgi:hypothetical protein